VAFDDNITNLFNVQKFHYIIASIKNEDKVLINHLQNINENILVA